MLHVHRAERADALVDALGDLLRNPPADPFAPEIVAVPTRGMERWLTQRLSARLGASPGRRDGVCANVDFPSPRALLGDAVAAASRIGPDADPWVAERLLWPLLDVIDANLDEPWLRPLATHLAGEHRRSRRLAAASRIAALFDRYALHRPELLAAWKAGESEGATWQAELWRALDAHLGLPGPAERLDVGCARLRAEPDCVALPDRLAVFGLTRLPAGRLTVLHALAARREVHLFLLHPSPALWERLRTAPRPQARARADDRTAALTEHPLLASWGRDSRELQLVIGNDAQRAHHHHHATPAPPATLLGAIQADIRGDRTPAGDARADRSIEVHACHGRARQVEVVRDAILQSLADDPSLEPRDVIVMCPDIEAFAPLIGATFGAGREPAADEEPPASARPADLRVRLADRSLRQTNPVLGVVAALLDLAGERVTASQVLDLADREPVRRRMRLSDDDLTRIRDWVAGSGIRWGLDAAHRAPFKLDRLGDGTWQAGLDRLLLGVAMTEDDDRLYAGVLPLDDVESGAIELAGRFAELVDRLGAGLDALARPQPLDAWAGAIAAAADALTATAPDQAWQRAELDRVLGDTTRAARGSRAELALPELRALLGSRLQGRPTRANFRTGHLTVCTLVPMRSVPHRVVCLLGLDDGVFPRKPPRDGDDLTLERPRIGERDPRSEDRQLLLDALLAATDRLIVTYTGNDERTNAPRAPAVPVGELLDAIDATIHPAERPARGRVVIRHPLQPFDPRNFATGRLIEAKPWSFDPVTLAGARALTGRRAQPPPFLAAPLPPRAGAVVEIESLVRFAEHPVKAFLRQRLGVNLADYSDEVDDALGVELDGLGRWGVGQRLLEARLAGVDARRAALAEIARGTLPAGALGRPVIDAVGPIVEQLVARARVLGDAPAASVDVNLRLPDGRLLSGTIPGVSGDVLRTATYSRLGPRHRLTAWTRLLALVAAHPDRPYCAATVGRGAGRSETRTVRISPPADRSSWALEHLANLLALYDEGMREPLPLYCETSAAFAQGGEEAARRAWTSGWAFDREDRELEHQLVLGGVLPFEALARAGHAERLWAGLLAAEVEE